MDGKISGQDLDLGVRLRSFDAYLHPMRDSAAVQISVHEFEVSCGP